MDKGQMLENHKKIPGKHQEAEVTEKCGIHLETGGTLADMLPGDFQCIFLSNRIFGLNEPIAKMQSLEQVKAGMLK